MPEAQSGSSRGAGFLLNVNLVFAGNVTGAGLSFLIAVLLARALGPEGRGVTSLYQGAVNLGYMILSMGIASAAVYFVARRDLLPRELLEAAASLTLLAAAVASRDSHETRAEEREAGRLRYRRSAGGRENRQRHAVVEEVAIGIQTEREIPA